jgi:hypothetical protein
VGRGVLTLSLLVFDPIFLFELCLDVEDSDAELLLSAFAEDLFLALGQFDRDDSSFGRVLNSVLNQVDENLLGSQSLHSNIWPILID